MVLVFRVKDDGDDTAGQKQDVKLAVVSKKPGSIRSIINTIIDTSGIKCDTN